MAVTLSIKNVPEDVLERLRQRARRHHRSLQGELRAILDEAIQPKPLSLAGARRRIRGLGLSTADEATTLIRQDRDGR